MFFDYEDEDDEEDDSSEMAVDPSAPFFSGIIHWELVTTQPRHLATRKQN
jgi:hypothetical protein